jgi:SAM-dependent methyltransferase
MHAIVPPSDWIERWVHLLRPGCAVLDLACGHGRHMRWLAARGFALTGIDRSREALSTAQTFGQVREADVEAGPWPLTGQQFGAVVVTNYLWRPLWPKIMDSLSPGGVLLYETFAQGNETVGKPSRPDFLLRPGELLEVCAQNGLRVVAFEDGYLPTPERFLQRIVAVRPVQGGAIARWPLA